jgi:glycosyltransferase involved in cell wall biosynthesis
MAEAVGNEFAFVRQLPKQKGRIAIVCGDLPGPWGGSEELWSRTAIHLLEQGIAVAACLQGWPSMHQRVQDLMRRGVEVWQRPAQYPVWKRLWCKLFAHGKTYETVEVERFLSAVRPTFIVLSCGVALPSIELVELCSAKKIPFVTIGQSNFEYWWFEDERAERYRRALPAARRCYFVSRANLHLAEKQLGCSLPNAEVVRNPFNVNIDALPGCLKLNADDEIRLACVGRLDPRSKGQDILLEALAEPVWMDRHWHLTLYGDGPMKSGLELLARRLKLEDRVTLAGHTSKVEEIWAANHVLVMPSRFEGLPLAMVEAMLCARPVVATDVAGHSEIVEDGVTGFLADAPTVASVSKALDKLWERRAELEKMGEAAAKKIRNFAPADPAKEFSEKLMNLAATTVTTRLPRATGPDQTIANIHIPNG